MNGYRAAAHLLQHCHLRVALADYESEGGTVDWGRLTSERANPGSESALICLAHSLADGVLGDTSRMDARNYDALLAALDVLAYGTSDGGDPLRAGRRKQ